MSTQDIEIYLQQTPTADILAWLGLRFPASAGARAKPAGKKQWRLTVQHGDSEIPVLVIEDSSPGFCTIWFDSTDTPWDSDIACAREVHAHFRKEVRATPGSWQEGDDPDLWWHINEQGEGLLHWAG